MSDEGNWFTRIFNSEQSGNHERAEVMRAAEARHGEGLTYADWVVRERLGRATPSSADIAIEKSDLAALRASANHCRDILSGVYSKRHSYYFGDKIVSEEEFVRLDSKMSAYLEKKLGFSPRSSGYLINDPQSPRMLWMEDDKREFASRLQREADIYLAENGFRFGPEGEIPFSEIGTLPQPNQKLYHVRKTEYYRDQNGDIAVFPRYWQKIRAPEFFKIN